MAARERETRRALRASLLDWATVALEGAGQAPAAHHRKLIDELEAVAAGRTRRLMVHMPPGAAKSTYASILFPAWWFARRPRSSVIAACHTAGLAEHFGRRLRALIDEHGPRLGYGLAAGDRAAHRFSTTLGGEYFATGVGGPITGRRADLALIDDPVRSHADADSAALREALWDWYRSDLLSRLKPGGRVVLVMTRWHPDDLGGRLAATPGWRILRLPAIAEADDPLGRAPGVALWPEWEDAEALAERRLAVGERAWAALYQQRPRLRQGGMFDPRRLRLVSVEEAARLAQGGPAVRAWDLAGTDGAAGGDPDWTVGLKLARAPEGGFVVLDVVRERRDAARVPALIEAVAAADGTGVRIGLPQDPGQAGKAQLAYMVGRLAGYRVTGSPETGAKETRALPVASQVEAGNLAVARAGWTPGFQEELAAFPLGAKDDQVDALSRAFNLLTEMRAPARRVALNHLAR